MALAQAELRFWHAQDEDPVPAAERAIEINPELPEAHCVEARYWRRRDQAEATRTRQALKLDPNPGK